MSMGLFHYDNHRNYRRTSARVGVANIGFIGASKIGSVISGYNSQYSDIVTSLNNKRIQLSQDVSNGLSIDPQFEKLRKKGVELAWEYEKYDVEMGGNGSNKWTRAERQEIRETGRVRGSEGHHQKNVADHPHEQANPDNIKFYRSKKEHLEQGHDGNWRNTSDSKLIDKNKMLQRTNAKRVVKKEVQGVALVVAVSFGIGASIEVISTLALNGISSDTVKIAFVNGFKSGIRSAGIGVVCYSATRVVDTTLQRVFGLGKIVAQNAAVSIVAVGFAVVEFIMLKKHGYTTKSAASIAGKHLAIGLGINALRLIPYCGVGLSIAASVIYVVYAVAIDVHNKRFLIELDNKVVLWSAPQIV